LPGKPGFTKIELTNGSVQVVGRSPADSPLPHAVRVTLAQARAAGEGASHVAEGPVDATAHDWHATFPSAGFSKGPAFAVGYEICIQPQFSVTTWYQVMNIE
jgi:hypothetical protein